MAVTSGPSHSTDLQGCHGPVIGPGMLSWYHVNLLPALSQGCQAPSVRAVSLTTIPMMAVSRTAFDDLNMLLGRRQTFWMIILKWGQCLYCLYNIKSVSLTILTQILTSTI